MARQFIYHMHGLNKAYRRQEGPGEHPPVLLPRRQDRHARPERLGQVDAAADHGRPRQGIHRRGLGGRGRDRRLPAAGAAARPDQERARQRHGGRRRQEGDPRPLQRADDELLRRDGRRGRQAPGHHRQPEPLGPRQPGRDGDGRAALPAGRCRRRPASRAARSAAWRSASCCCRSPTCCCSTSRPTTSTPRPIAWLEKHLREYPGRGADHHPRPLLPRQRHRLDPRARPRPRHSLRGQLLGLSRRPRPSACSRKAARRPPARRRSRASGVDRGQPEGPPGEVQGPHPRL